MKIGILYLNEIKYDELVWVIVKKGIDGEVIDTEISINSTSNQDTEKVVGLLKENGIDIAISMDFCPAISDACEKLGIKYVAWVYDAPQQALYNKQITNSCNHIFSFDRDQTGEALELGALDARHLPLGTNVYRNTSLVVDKEDEKRFACDVSFIGNMYVDDFYDKVYAQVSNNIQKELDDIMADAMGVWDGKSRIYGRLSPEATSELIEASGYRIYESNPFAMPVDRYLGTRILAIRLTELERKEIARRLSKYDFRLYTNTENFALEGVDVRPALSYDESLPKAYHLSKINLNITLHSITSGIPLRVFDIMGVGGFMLSNYQPEIEELFKIGRDIEVYRNIDELEDKVRYYLSHEEARSRIAINGYHTVSEKYSYDAGFEKIMTHLGIEIN